MATSLRVALQEGLKEIRVGEVTTAPACKIRVQRSETTHDVIADSRPRLLLEKQKVYCSCGVSREVARS